MYTRPKMVALPVTVSCKPYLDEYSVVSKVGGLCVREVGR